MGERQESIITRHGDKGGWKINEEELRGALPEVEANIALDILKTEFPDWDKTPLKLDGIKRSLNLGDEVFAMLPDDCVVVVMDSGKDRAQLTRALAVERIYQLESNHNRENPKEKKRIDMLQVEEGEITALLKDSDDSTWRPYGDMRDKEGISESEALFRWLNDMNKPDSGVDPKVAPQESARRYRLLVEMMHKEGVGITSDKPVVLFGVGHGGSLGQAKYEDIGVRDASETPQFCEMFRFGKDGKLEGTKHVEI